MKELVEQWLLAPWSDLVMALISVVVIYVVIIGLTRVAGLRSFSKMSAFDFAMTVAIGSLFASTVVSADPPVLRASVAMLGLFAGQWLIACLRCRSDRIRRLVDNEPILLMAGPQILHQNLKKADVTMADLQGKLREANVLQYNQVRAVVMETTGDISVLHTDDSNTELDHDIIKGVRGADTHFSGSREYRHGQDI